MWNSFSAANNELSGEVPGYMADAANLVRVNLAGNLLAGPAPPATDNSSADSGGGGGLSTGAVVGICIGSECARMRQVDPRSLVAGCVGTPATAHVPTPHFLFRLQSWRLPRWRWASLSSSCAASSAVGRRPPPAPSSLIVSWMTRHLRQRRRLPPSTRRRHPLQALQRLLGGRMWR
jgi:hypothetical protein